VALPEGAQRGPDKEDEFEELSFTQTVLQNLKLVTSLKELSVTESKVLKEPWDLGYVENTQVCMIPTNYKELSKVCYLFPLYIQTLVDNGCTLSLCNKTYNTRLTYKKDTETFLKAYGVILRSGGKVVDIPSRKNMIWKGIGSSLKSWLQAQKDIDISLTKVSQCDNPAQFIFGDVWGKNFPIEKRMLDYIVNKTRDLPNISVLKSDLIYPANKIIKDKGLNIEFKSSLISTAERDTLNMYLQKNNISPEFNKIRDDEKAFIGLEQINQLKATIVNRQKEVRAIKRIVKDVVSKRVQACFAPFTGQQRKKASKRQITELKDELKQTIHWTAFNPTVFNRLLPNVTQLPNNPLMRIDSDLFRDTLDSGYDELLAAGFSPNLATSMMAEYKEYASNLEL
jgi:hypothetical protein